MKQEQFFRSVCSLAIPVTLQSMLQASFGVVDQIMIGQLGSVDVAAVGLAGKFTSMFTVVVSAVSAVAGIMISQYMGQRNQAEVRRSLAVNMMAAVGLAVLFTVLCTIWPAQIMGLYSPDGAVAAAGYLTIVAGTFLPAAGASLLSTMLRCMEKASLPLYAGFLAAILNTALNYMFIFGKCGLSPMGVAGAAAATVIAQTVHFLLILLMYFKHRIPKETAGDRQTGGFDWQQYFSILMPVFICEFLWSAGENVYAVIYGHLGTDAVASMTLLGPIQGLMIGALSGLSQAAGVIVGKMLGRDDGEKAYAASKKLMLYGLVGSLALSLTIIVIRPWYVSLFRVEEPVRILTEQIMAAYALVAPFKIQNMIVGGGIIRSGGKTKFVMFIDLIGTWIFGVPLGLLAAFVFHLTIPYVYFILSLEECVRFAMSVLVFRKKNWMGFLKSEREK